MWIQIGIGAGTGLLWLLWRMKIIPVKSWDDKKIRRQTILLIELGCLLGSVLTFQRGGNKYLTEEEHRIKREENFMIREYDVLFEGKRETIQVQIPEKQSADQEENQQEENEQGKSLQEKLKEQVSEWNQDKEASDYYELPKELDGEKIVWMYPKQNDGLILTALFLLLAIGFIFLQKQREAKKKEERKEALLMDYPGMIIKMALLLQAGMTVRMAFRRIAEDYKKVRKNGTIRVGYEEILATCLEMESGIAEITAYERLGVRCGEIRYKTLSTLLTQNLKKGSRSLIDSLEREAEDAFEERKRTARILGEKASTKLLFPMLLMLIVVLTLIMIPAILSFYGGYMG